MADWKDSVVLNTGGVPVRPLTGTVRDHNLVRLVPLPKPIKAWSLDIEIDAELFRELTPGYSGSPVLDDETGAVVGIVNLRWSGVKGHALCVDCCRLLLAAPDRVPIPGFDWTPERGADRGAKAADGAPGTAVPAPLSGGVPAPPDAPVVKGQVP